jgi:hypothetical protein
MIDLDSGENVMIEVRRHPLPFILEISFLAIFIILPPAVYIGIKSISIPVLSGLGASEFLFVYSCILLISWITFFIVWTNYYLDVLLVTNSRIIDIEQKRFFHRDMATLRLDKIEDVKIEITGFIATIFDYGMVYIQTAGESREFIVHDVPHPNKVKNLILDLHNKILNAPQKVQVVQ